MPTHCAYDYAVIRVVPRVEREEFVNVGVVVSCPEHRFLEAAVDLDEGRVHALDGATDMDAVRRHLASMARICAGGIDAGPIGRLPQRERFRWVTAARSTIIQCSPVHTGQCGDPKVALARLLESMVRRPPASDGITS